MERNNDIMPIFVEYLLNFRKAKEHTFANDFHIRTQLQKVEKIKT